VWCVGDEEVVGAAIWAPAGVEPLTATEGEAFAARCGELAGRDADGWAELVGLLDDNHPHHAEHDYLWFPAVRPTGRGTGTALLRAVLDRADRSGTPAHLDAPIRTAAAATNGTAFGPSGSSRSPAALTLWQMWREP
jgi:GNAT superfamily N-acetyltransferase